MFNLKAAKTIAVGGLLSMTVISANALVIPLDQVLGSIVGGTGTVTISPANSGTVTAFSMSGGFQFTPTYLPYFGLTATPFQFQASSAGTQI